MLKNTTLKLPEGLVVAPAALPADNPLLAYSQGRLARAEAIRLLGLRDYAELLAALGDANLPMPMPPPQDIEDQAANFARLWREE